MDFFRFSRGDRGDLDRARRLGLRDEGLRDRFRRFDFEPDRRFVFDTGEWLRPGDGRPPPPLFGERLRPFGRTCPMERLRPPLGDRLRLGDLLREDKLLRGVRLRRSGDRMPGDRLRPRGDRLLRFRTW